MSRQTCSKVYWWKQMNNTIHKVDVSLFDFTQKKKRNHFTGVTEAKSIRQTLTAWWFQPTPLKNDGVRQWEGLFPYMKWKNKSHVPNHQPVIDYYINHHFSMVFPWFSHKILKSPLKLCCFPLRFIDKSGRPFGDDFLRRQFPSSNCWGHEKVMSGVEKKYCGIREQLICQLGWNTAQYIRGICLLNILGRFSSQLTCIIILIVLEDIPGNHLKVPLHVTHI